MERKEDTPVRKTRRKYEEKNKEKRKQASGNFGTMIPRALYDEINAFLEENGITKVRLIKEGYDMESYYHPQIVRVSEVHLPV